MMGFDTMCIKLMFERLIQAYRDVLWHAGRNDDFCNIDCDLPISLLLYCALIYETRILC